jgi:hypothetical protein
MIATKTQGFDKFIYKQDTAQMRGRFPIRRATIDEISFRSIIPHWNPGVVSSGGRDANFVFTSHVAVMDVPFSRFG